MNATSPLNIAKNAANKCGDLFRTLAKPGYSMFAKIGAEQIDKAAADASSAASEIDSVLADGRVDPSEIQRLRSASMRLHHIAG